MADDKSTEEEEKPKSKKMLFIILGVVLLLGGGAAAFFLMSGEEPKSAETEATEEADLEAIYFDIKPPIVVNYDWRGRKRYVQISAAIMTRKPEVIEALTKHMPLVRNELVMVFGGADFEGLRTQEGKEALREKAKDKLESIVSDELGYPGVEQLLFTNFVMQ